MSSKPSLSSSSRSHAAMTLTTASAATAVAAHTAMETLALKLAEICSHAAEDYPWDPPRRFTVLAQRLQLLVAQLSHPGVLPSSPAVSTALRGIAGDVSATVSTLSSYRSRSRIYVLIHCLPLCSSLRSLCSSLASSLALLDAPLSCQPDLQKRASDLARDFLLSDLRVTETEERVYSALQREGEARESGQKAVQSGIIMDLARALGAGPEALADQIKLLRSDLTGPSTSPAERRILVSLEKIFGSWLATEPCVADRSIDVDFDENATIPPFKNFLCPLTKVVMKDPVVLESLQTYERGEIKHWFDWCLEDGRDPTCPVTGQVLQSLELKPNIGLAGAIEEWVNRNIEVQIKSAVQCLGQETSSSLESVERALDNVYRISEEHPTSRYRVRNAGIVGLVVKMLKEQSKMLGPELRTKALMVMDSVAKDHESKLMMLEEGLSRLAIRSLNGSSEKEREYALNLLLQFSHDRGYCAKLASEKGALVLLSSLAENLQYPRLSNMAEEVLKNMEKEEDNVQHLAVVGRFQPLLNRLCEGSEDVRINMANIVGNMKLTNTYKEHVARQGGRALIAMLSSKPEGRASSLQALYNLSTLDDNSTILVDFGLLPALNNILFMTRPDDQPDLKDLAALTISNIVSNTGHWELSFADDQGHLMQSESVIHSLLQLLTNSSSKCQIAILKILCGIASSPQALELAAAHIGSGNGIAIILPFLEHPETEQRINAFKLANLLSRNLGLALAYELRTSNKLISLKEKLLDPQCLSG
ncbi:Zinc finger RING/FYVE/PHD-type protein [Dioscorea alata]|uniref:Zinc finger RING/FYVE/PHD-type protein n=1 Tax=Dioscorea alata TaxID=55571 RepID=A0ACB7VFR2_DIOAL|nr:Zinc finger RING/FYVE/PHD-type protein [Dioscorea alata]